MDPSSRRRWPPPEPWSFRAAAAGPPHRGRACIAASLKNSGIVEQPLAAAARAGGPKPWSFRAAADWPLRAAAGPPHPKKSIAVLSLSRNRAEIHGFSLVADPAAVKKGAPNKTSPSRYRFLHNPTTSFRRPFLLPRALLPRIPPERLKSNLGRRKPHKKLGSISPFRTCTL